MAQIDNLDEPVNGFNSDLKPPDDRKVDLTELCRLCLLTRHPREMTEIFPTISTDSWKTIIVNITNIKVNFGDGLPALICNLCVRELNLTKEFKEKSVAGDEMLRNNLFQPASGTKVLSRIYKQRRSVVDLSCLCRLCATYFVPCDTATIFDGSGTDSLAAKISKVTNVKVAVDDGLPASICDFCAPQLCRASDFVANSVAKDLYLRTELFQVKNEVGELGTATDPLEPDLKPEVKREPVDPAVAAVADTAETETRLPEPLEPVETRVFQGRIRSERAALSAATADQACTTKAGEPRKNPHNQHSLVRKRKRKAPPKKVGPKESFPCQWCGKTLSTRHFLSRHLSIVHEWKCGLCGEVFRTETSRAEHKQAVHHIKMDMLYHCDICQKTLSSRKKLAFHIKRMHLADEYDGNMFVQCDICKKKLGNKLACARHLTTHSEVKIDFQKSVRCDLCELKFWTKEECGRHRRTHPEIRAGTERTFKCDLCGNKFWSKRACVVHIKLHLQDRRFKCPLCEKCFKSAGSVISHQVVHTSERPHKCDKCVKSFKSKGNLNIHLLRHTSTDKRFSCKNCDQQFSTQAEVEAHRSVHSGARPYACTKCFKTYKIRSHLTNHMASHSKAALPCTVCGKVLGTQKNLEDHMRQHTGDFPFKCTVCERPFPLKSTLTRHMKVHAEREKKFQCHVCKRKFLCKQGLLGHLVSHRKR